MNDELRYNDYEYVCNLEKYCDYLEKQLGDSYLIDTLNRLEKTEKALDRVCDEVSYFQTKFLKTLNLSGHKAMTKKNWKDWAMKND